MIKLIDLNEYPVKQVLSTLLLDMTTGRNIVFATDGYPGFNAEDEITIAALETIDLKPRILKEREIQDTRTKENAEVMTPAWIVNKMNNHCDLEWFGYPDVFNEENGEQWKTKKESISFPEGKTWQEYVYSTRLEITCGEAPYLVSRYDTTTGGLILLNDRIGILDRKLRVVGENTKSKKDWLQWVTRAFQSVYGYEYQGDSLLIGRINLLMTFVDYYINKWETKPSIKELAVIANIVTWNLWQMDGLTGGVPYAFQEAQYQQVTMFGIEEAFEKEPLPAKVFDWRDNVEVLYNNIGGKW